MSNGAYGLARTALAARMIATALLLAAAGCGGGGGGGGSVSVCDLPNEGECLEWSSLSLQNMSTYKSQCASVGGIWSQERCPRDQVYAGCQLTTDGITETIWSRTPITIQQEQMQCSGTVVTGDAQGGGIGGSYGTGGNYGTGGRSGTGGTVYGIGGSFGTGGYGTGGGACTDCTVVNLPIAAEHLLYDAGRDRLYATVAGAAAMSPNTVVIIDPTAGTVESTIPAGSDPRVMALSDDGSTLWVGIDGAFAVRRITLTASPPAVGPQTALPTTVSSAPTAQSMVVLPGTPLSVAVALYVEEYGESSGTVVLDDGVLRAGTSAPIDLEDSPSYLALGSPGDLFGVGGFSTEFFVLGVSAAGIVSNPFQGLISAVGNIHASGNLVFVDSGEVVDVTDPTHPARAGKFDFQGPIAVRSASHVFMLSTNYDSYPQQAPVIRVLDPVTFTQVGAVQLSSSLFSYLTTAFDLVYAGGDAVAFIVSDNPVDSSGVATGVYLVHAPLLASP